MDRPSNGMDEVAEEIRKIVVQGALDPAVRKLMTPILNDLRKKGLDKLSNRIERIWDGERDPEALAQDLDDMDRWVITHALADLEHPEDFEEPEEEEEDDDEAPDQTRQLVNIFAGAADDPEMQKEMESIFAEIIEQGGEGLVLAVRRIWTGERDEAALIEGLNERDEEIVQMVLAELKSYDEEMSEEFDVADASKYLREMVKAFVNATKHPEIRQELEPVMEERAGADMKGLPGAVRRIWAGERDEAALTKGLEEFEQYVVQQVLAKL